MLSELYERIAQQPDGLRLMAGSRLRRRVLVLLHKALDRSGLTQADLAKKLGRRRSAVNQVLRGDGNLRIETLAEYLHEMGYELDIQLVAAGELRSAALEGRRPRGLGERQGSTSTTVLVASALPGAGLRLEASPALRTPAALIAERLTGPRGTTGVTSSALSVVVEYQDAS